MARPAGLSALVLTAQDLRSGEVVYWQGERWTRSIADALVSHDEAALQALAAAANAGTEVTDAFTFAVIDVPDGRRPVRYREAWRLAGPSIAFGPAATA